MKGVSTVGDDRGMSFFYRTTVTGIINRYVAGGFNNQDQNGRGGRRGRGGGEREAMKPEEYVRDKVSDNKS